MHHHALELIIDTLGLLLAVVLQIQTLFLNQNHGELQIGVDLLVFHDFEVEDHPLEMHDEVVGRGRHAHALGDVLLGLARLAEVVRDLLVLDELPEALVQTALILHFQR